MVKFVILLYLCIFNISFSLVQSDKPEQFVYGRIKLKELKKPSGIIERFLDYDIVHELDSVLYEIAKNRQELINITYICNGEGEIKTIIVHYRDIPYPIKKYFKESTYDTEYAGKKSFFYTPPLPTMSGVN